MTVSLAFPLEISQGDRTTVFVHIADVSDVSDVDDVE